MIWYAGLEGGRALGDVLTGAEPGGRLPFAVPHTEADLVEFSLDATTAITACSTASGTRCVWGRTPSPVRPRAQLRRARHLRCQTRARRRDRGHGREPCRQGGSSVVLAYGSVPGSAFDRPPRRLVGFAKTRFGPRATVELTIPIDIRQLDVRVDGQWYREDLPTIIEVGLDGARTQKVT